MSKGKKNQNTGNGEQSVEDEIVLKAYMHCEGCVSKISSCLKGFEGIEEVKTDMQGDRVTVKGKKADPLKVLERMKTKYSRNVELISPIPKPKPVANDHKDPPKKQEKPIEVVLLKMYIHCEGCAKDIKRSIEKMEGILKVEPDMKNSTVGIEGRFDQSNIVETIRQRLRKYAELVEVKSKDKGNGNANKKCDDKGNGNANKKCDDKGNSNANKKCDDQGNGNAIKKFDDQGNGNTKKKVEQEKVIILSYPPQYSAQCPNHIFSDENIFSCSIM